MRHSPRIRSPARGDLPRVSVPQTRQQGKFLDRTLVHGRIGDRRPTIARRGAAHAQPDGERALARTRARVEEAGPRGDRRGAVDQPDRVRGLRRLARLAGALGGPRRARGDRRLPRRRRRPCPQADPRARDLRRRERAAPRRHHEPAPRLVLEQEVPPAVEPLPRRRHRGRRRDARAHAPGRAQRDGRRVRRHARRLRDLPARARELRADHGPLLRHELPDPARADAAARHPADQGLRARGRRLGRQAGRHPRPAGGQGGDHQGGLALAVRRGVREGRRQARARRALPGPAGHGQDDALQGHRDVVQLPVRDHPGLRLRADVHRHRRDHRPLPRAQGEEARRQVGRPVHRLHRRDRRGRDAAPRGALYPAIFGRLKGVVDQFMIPGMGGGGSLALNQLLVTMDGINEPPFKKKFLTNRLNTFLDALYVVPRKVGGMSLRLRPPRPRKEEIYFIGACNVPLETLDPALVRPGRMGRHIHFRTPTWEDRRDIFDLYIAKVAHEEDLDSGRKRDELARVTSAYSEGRPEFGWDDIVEARTTVEAGVAIGQEYPPHEERATAIHEAGHAVCSHLYNENLLSTRLSIRKRGSSGGHHQAMEIEERFADWRSEMFGRLIHVLGAMAAEVVFYGQNTTGVGGDVRSVTWLAGRMVGFAAMAPQRIDLADRIEDRERRAEEEDRVMERFERIGIQIMHRSGGGVMDADPMQAVVNDPAKRKLVAGLLGQAYVVAYNTIRANEEGVGHVADVLVAKREIYGDDVVALLDEAGLRKPEIDVLDEDAWPAT